MPFIPHTEADIREMLAAIGVDDIEGLFDEIPAELRCGELKAIPHGLPDRVNGRRRGRQMEQNTPNRGPSGSAIRFSCAFCGQQIRVSPVHAGKKAKCPNCKNIVIIPQPAPEPQQPKEDEPIRLKRDAEPPPRQVGLSPEQAQDWYRRSQEPTANAVIFSPPPEPKPATILDVFTFPFSLAGIIHFLLFWLGPVFLTGVLFVRFFLWW